MAFTRKPLEFIFFDIGGTLGEYDSAIGKLIPFPSTPKLLAQAGLAEFLYPDGTSHRPHPHPKQTRS